VPTSRAIEDHLSQLDLLPDVIRHLARVDHDFVRQKDQQFRFWLRADELDDILRDHLLGDEMGTEELGKIVTSKPRHGRNPIGKVIECIRPGLKTVRQLRLLGRGERRASPDFA
jgi:hypothetical protein